MSLFKRATRKSIFINLAITGPSGSGKTMSALRLARGLIGPDAPMAFIDTENGAAAHYADKFVFDSVEMNPPYSVSKYVKAIEDAVQNGYKALIIDSLSHSWIELLAKKEALDSRGGNSFTNWSTITKEHEMLKAAILSSKIHIIGCMRSKQDYVIEQNDKGKSAPKKVGMAAVQRDGMEYEFTTVFDLGMDHHFSVSKDRTSLFDGRMEIVTEKIGNELATWLSQGGDPLPPEKPKEEPPASDKVVDLFVDNINEPEPPGLFKSETIDVEPPELKQENRFMPPQEKHEQQPSAAPTRRTPLVNNAPPAHAAAPSKYLEQLWNDGKRKGMTEKDLMEIQWGRLKKKNWMDMTNFEAKAIKNAIDSWTK